MPMGHVPIDRGLGVDALRSMTEGCRRALDSRQARHRFFPQGTRVAPGEVKPYKAGIAKMYKIWVCRWCRLR